MAIVKKYNGKKAIIAEKNLIDHNQLSNRQQLNCHPISAIRNLPEKLTAIKKNAAAIQSELDELEEDVATLTTKTSNITLQAEGPVLKFNNPVSDNIDEIDFLDKVDADTIQYVDDVGVALKKVYTDATLSGTGADSEHPLIVEGLKDTDGTLTAAAIKASIQAEHSTNETQTAQIIELQNKVKGSGGYLTAYDFGTVTPTQTALTNYALQELSVTDIQQIPDQTRVKNLKNNHLWVVNIREVEGVWTAEWVDNGLDTVSTATQSLLGVVKGSDADLKCAVDINGELSVNGLAETLTDIEQDITDEIQARSDADTALEEAIEGKQDSFEVGGGLSLVNGVLSGTMGYEQLQFPYTPANLSISGDTLSFDAIPRADTLRVIATNTTTQESIILGEVSNE